jgi:type VII secretion integral membrane protein EccD
MRMQDGRSRITVVGERKRVDVAVPTATPIGEYADSLADMCGQTHRGVMPPAWSLARAGDQAVPLGASLGDAGIGDGQVLYLQDVTRDTGSAPEVDDIDEMVIAEAQRLGDRGPPRGVAVIGLGMGWLATAAVLLLVDPDLPVISAAVSLVCGGLLLLSTGWALVLRRSGVPAAMCLAMALTSIPCFGAAGALLAGALAGSAYAWVGAAIGCNAAAILTLVATPEPVVVAVELPLAVGMVIAPLLVVMQADAKMSAAAISTLALGMIAVARPIAAAITVFTVRARDTGSGGHVTTQTLIQSRQLVAVVVAGPVIAASVALVVLARSGGWFSLGLICVVTIALAIRARQAVVKQEIILLAAAATIGAFALLSSARALLPSTAWLPVLLVGFGMLMIAVGVVSTVTADPSEPPEIGPPKRKPLDIVGTVCSALTIPLALGVFGVLEELYVIGMEILS